MTTPIKTQVFEYVMQRSNPNKWMKILSDANFFNIDLTEQESKKLLVKLIDENQDICPDGRKRAKEALGLESDKPNTLRVVLDVALADGITVGNAEDDVIDRDKGALKGSMVLNIKNILEADPMIDKVQWRDYYANPADAEPDRKYVGRCGSFLDKGTGAAK